MEVDEKSKKPKKAKTTYYAIAYVVLLRDRIAANPNFTGDMLNDELKAVGDAYGEAKRGKK